MTCGIYKITNTVTGECYIGKSKNIELRWKNHQSGMLRGEVSSYGTTSRLLAQSCIDHGFDAFIFEILEVAKEDCLGRLEHKWMQALEPTLNCQTYVNGNFVHKGLEVYLNTIRKTPKVI